MNYEALKKYIINSLEKYAFLENPMTVVPFKPDNIYIEPTNLCNLDCMCCYGKGMKREKGMMSLQDFKRILDNMIRSDWKTSITLTGQGEPLLNKDIYLMIEYARDAGFNVSLISNGTALNPVNRVKLFLSGLNRLQVMFDSIDKESFEAFRLGAKFERVKENITAFILENEKRGHPIYIGMGAILCSITKESYENTKEYWTALPIDNWFPSDLYSLMNTSGMYEEAMALTKGRKRGRCLDPFFTLSVNWDGSCQLCPMDCNATWIIGDASKDHFDEIWNGSKAQALRKAMIEQDDDFFKRTNHRCDMCNIPLMPQYTLEEHSKYIPDDIIRRIKQFKNE